MMVNYANFGDLLTKRGVFRMKKGIYNVFSQRECVGIE